jgi:oxygen-dependent protoporphyrinogen oxidase
VKRIAIVGGGISGLAAAYELERQREHPCTYTLFEATGRLGGTVETVRQDGFVIECGPDSWVTEKPWAREVAEELGLRGEILPSNDAQRCTYLARQDGLQPIPDAMRMMVPKEWAPLLASPLFSDDAKRAYQREPERAEELKRSALLARGDDADESVDAFVRRHFGGEVTETVAGPLLAGVFGGDIGRLSVRSVMAPFVKMEAEHGSLINALQQRRTNKTEASSVFTTLASGLQTLTDQMAGSLLPSSILRNTRIDAIARIGAGWRVQSNGEGDSADQDFDAVVLATPLESTRRLLTSVHNPHAEAAAAFLPAEASSAIVVALGYEQAIGRTINIPRGFGFLVPPVTGSESGTVDSSNSLLACTFVDQKFAHRAPDGGVLLRAFFGGVAAERLLQTEDAPLALLAREQLSRLLGPLSEAQVTVVRRWPRSLPQYAVGHLERMQRLDEEMRHLDGLVLAGNAYHGVGLPDLVRDGREAARRIVRHS